MLIIDNFISPSDKEKLMSRAAYDDETDLWILQPNAKGSGSAIHKRPVSAAGSRRPMSEYARVQSGLPPGKNYSIFTWTPELPEKFQNAVFLEIF